MKPSNVIAVAISVVSLTALAYGGAMLWSNYTDTPLPISERCVAEVSGKSVAVTIEQAQNAAVIAGVSVKRSLIPRAASIALATAYQESGIRNLDYGHSDSLGLFQQRPSKGWGTKAEVMDPWYSSTAFYKELVKFRDWKTKDINDMAQSVQRSAYPEAYRKHVDNARILASALTGETPAGFSCAIHDLSDPNPAGLQKILTKSFGKKIKINDSEASLTITATDTAAAWSAASSTIAYAKQFGVTQVKVGNSLWKQDPWSLPTWAEQPADAANTVTVSFSG